MGFGNRQRNAILQVLQDDNPLAEVSWLPLEPLQIGKPTHD
jgi:hypothetical protein